MKISQEMPNLGKYGKNIGMLHEHLSKFYRCRHEFATQASLCDTQYFYTVDSNTLLNNAHNVLFRSHYSSGYANELQCANIVHYLSGL